MTAQEAAETLYSQLEELQVGKKQIEEEIAQIRNDLSIIAANQPDSVLLLRYAEIKITAPGVRRSYDAKQIDKLHNILMDHQLYEYAKQIALAIKTTEIAGSLRITPKKA